MVKKLRLRRSANRYIELQRKYLDEKFEQHTVILKT